MATIISASGPLFRTADYTDGVYPNRFNPVIKWVFLCLWRDRLKRQDRRCLFELRYAHKTGQLNARQTLSDGDRLCSGLDDTPIRPVNSRTNADALFASLPVDEQAFLTGVKITGKLDE